MLGSPFSETPHMARVLHTRAPRLHMLGQRHTEPESGSPGAKVSGFLLGVPAALSALIPLLSKA